MTSQTGAQSFAFSSGTHYSNYHTVIGNKMNGVES